MPHAPLTHFEPDPDRLACLGECLDLHGLGPAEAEWPNNMISRRAIVYGSGAIARQGSPIRHAVDPDELALCRRLAAEAAALMAGVDVGMGSESSDEFREFFIAANADEPAPGRIDEGLIRSRFGGTLFPPSTITVEPMAEAGVWWSEVEEDGADSEADYLDPWRTMIGWFRDRSEFVNSAFVRIGDREALWEVPKKEFPEGTETTPCVLPRLALGLTRGGSLVGLFGISVQT
jgi:hypothetical protein